MHECLTDKELALFFDQKNSSELSGVLGERIKECSKCFEAYLNLKKIYQRSKAFQDYSLSSRISQEPSVKDHMELDFTLMEEENENSLQPIIFNEQMEAVSKDLSMRGSLNSALKTIFLQKNGKKFYFYSRDNKIGLIILQALKELSVTIDKKAYYKSSCKEGEEISLALGEEYILSFENEQIKFFLNKKANKGQ